MPPRKQITKEQIIEKAYALSRANGFERLTVRILAAELHCSTQPIYVSFQDMKELKNTLAEKALQLMTCYMEKYEADKQPALLSRILGYVEFANQEKHLYQLIFSSEIMSQDKVISLVHVENELELNMLLYAHGIIMMSTFGTISMEWTQCKELILKAYQHFQN